MLDDNFNITQGTLPGGGAGGSGLWTPIDVPDPCILIPTTNDFTPVPTWGTDPTFIPRLCAVFKAPTFNIATAPQNLKPYQYSKSGGALYLDRRGTWWINNPNPAGVDVAYIRFPVADAQAAERWMRPGVPNVPGMQTFDALPGGAANDGTANTLLLPWNFYRRGLLVQNAGALEIVIALRQFASSGISAPAVGIALNRYGSLYFGPDECPHSILSGLCSTAVLSANAIRVIQFTD